MTGLVLDRVGKTVRKIETAGYQYFLVFLHCFCKASSLWYVLSLDCVVNGQLFLFQFFEIIDLEIGLEIKHCNKRKQRYELFVQIPGLLQKLSI